jgi:hypothetical protein
MVARPGAPREVAALPADAAYSTLLHLLLSEEAQAEDVLLRAVQQGWPPVAQVQASGLPAVPASALGAAVLHLAHAGYRHHGQSLRDGLAEPHASAQPSATSSRVSPEPLYLHSSHKCAGLRTPAAAQVGVDMSHPELRSLRAGPYAGEALSGAAARELPATRCRSTGPRSLLKLLAPSSHAAASTKHWISSHCP